MWEKVGKSQRPSIIRDMTDPKLLVSDEKDQMIYVLGNNLSSFFFGLSLKAFIIHDCLDGQLTHKEYCLRKYGSESSKGKSTNFIAQKS